MDQHQLADSKKFWTGILLANQDRLVESVGTPAWFEADKVIRRARRELRRLCKQEEASR